MVCLDNTEVCDIFAYLREEGECYGELGKDIEYWEIENKIEERFIKDFPQLEEFVDSEAIQVEVMEHELLEDEDYPTYSVYLWVSNKLYDNIVSAYPHYYI